MTTLETLLTDPETTGAWTLAPDRSSVGFRIKNMWGVLPVKGRFTDISGDGRLTDEGTISGRLTIEVASLRTGIGRRDRHLLSADFFDAERFPQIIVLVTALQPTVGNSAELQTNFTIKGISEPVPLPVTITESDDGSVRILGETQIDRTRFDVDWNKLGVMADTVTVSSEAVFVRSAETG